VDPASTSNLGQIYSINFQCQGAAGAGDITSRIYCGFWQNSAPTQATGWPLNSSWYHLLTSTHSNTANYYSMQIAADFFSQNLWYRSTAGNGSTGWQNILIANSGSYNGSLTMSGNITAYSDIRLKENIVTIDNALNKILSMRGIYYNKKDDDKKEKKVGVVAQEIQKILPEVVITRKITYEKNGEEYLAVDYGNIVAVLIEAIKEQQTQIEALKSLLK
jgi:hypothetical protein